MTTARSLRQAPGILGSTGLALISAIVAVLATPAAVLASTAPGLGTASGFAVLAGTPVVTNTGPSAVSGSVGVAPAAAVTGFPPGVVSNGTIEGATPAATVAKGDLTTAYGVAEASPCNFNRTGQNLGGLTLTPGTYCQTTAPTITGTVTLSGDGVFILQIGSTLVTAPGASVVLTNGAQACNVYWQVASSATIDTTTTFVGTIMALTDISVNDGAHITGRTLARNGQVTLINDTITVPSACTAAAVAGPTGLVAGPSPGPKSPATPDTGTGTSGGTPQGVLVLIIGLTLVVLSTGTGVTARSRRRGSY